MAKSQWIDLQDVEDLPDWYKEFQFRAQQMKHACKLLCLTLVMK